MWAVLWINGFWEGEYPSRTAAEVECARRNAREPHGQWKAVEIGYCRICGNAVGPDTDRGIGCHDYCY